MWDAIANAVEQVIEAVLRLVEPPLGAAFRWTRRGGFWAAAVRFVVVAVLVGGACWGSTLVTGHTGEPSAVGLEMAGDQATFLRVLDLKGPSLTDGTKSVVEEAGCNKKYELDPTCAKAVELARRTLHDDYRFITTYTLAALVLCLLGAASARSPRTKTLLYGAAWAAVLAGSADFVEDRCLDRALKSGASPNAIRGATIAATAKWSLAPVVLVGALVGLGVYLRRRVDRPVPTRVELDRSQRFAPPASDAWDFDTRGICFSGGGIRSGSFCLGVMQQLEVGDGERGSALAKTRYLAAVSGGGYIAGAAQLHASLEQARRIKEAREANGTQGAAADAAETTVRATPAPPPFPPGSPEEDHLRRHGNYLADTALEWFNAVAQALGKLLANLALVALIVVAASQLMGWMGRLLLGAKDSTVDPPGDFPRYPMTVVIALAVLAAPALILATARRHSAVRAPGQRLWQGVRAGGAASLAIALGAGAVVLATTAFVFPLIDGLGKHSAGLIGHPKGVIAAGWPMVVLTWTLTRLNTKAMKREGTGGTAPADPMAAKPEKKGPNLFIARNATELLAGPVIALVVLGYTTALATLGRVNGPAGVLRKLGGFEVRDWHLAAVAGAIFFLILLTVDAVSWSMHRFYKRRLWSAFTYDGHLLGERDWTTPTRLSEHGKRLAGRPELVLCGAAEVSGPTLAPPGHRAVTWTFTHDWVGGPEIGWCRATTMEDELAKHGRVGDVSMFGAIAIAGAAFGSAMGRQSRGTLNSVFALSNARLGVWLPNPAQLRGFDPDNHKSWTYKRHTLTYLVREIFGRYAPDGRWILVADGGHYENLGLVELFRRRCTRIVCIDASGDASGAVTTVAEALRNAQLELGVTVTIPAHDDVVTAEVADLLAVIADGADQLGLPAEVAQQLVANAAARLGITDKVAEVLGVVAEVAELIGLPVAVSEQLIVHAANQLATASDTSPWDVAPGEADLAGSTEKLADALRHRLARQPIVRGTITYPPEAGLPHGKIGHLIIGRAVLDPKAPWPVVSYAVGNDEFPNDSTGDQWFNADQFDDYVLLGRYLGTRLLPEMQNIGWYL